MLYECFVLKGWSVRTWIQYVFLNVVLGSVLSTYFYTYIHVHCTYIENKSTKSKFQTLKYGMNLLYYFSNMYLSLFVLLPDNFWSNIYWKQSIHNSFLLLSLNILCIVQKRRKIITSLPLALPTQLLLSQCNKKGDQNREN